MKFDDKKNHRLLAAIDRINAPIKNMAAAMQRVQAPILEINKPFEKLKEIGKGSKSGEFVLGAVADAAEDTLVRNDLDPDERQFLSNAFGEFAADFAKVVQSEDTCDKDIVLRVVVRAFVIGEAARLTPEKLAKLMEKFSKERTLPANDARRADDIKDIIEKAANDLWGRKPSFKNNKRGTATNIRAVVRRELSKLATIPTVWKLADDNDEAAVAREIERIRKRIPGCPS